MQVTVAEVKDKLEHLYRLMPPRWMMWMAVNPDAHKEYVQLVVDLLSKTKERGEIMPEHWWKLGTQPCGVCKTRGDNTCFCIKLMFKDWDKQS